VSCALKTDEFEAPQNHPSGAGASSEWDTAHRLSATGQALSLSGGRAGDIVADPLPAALP